MVSQDADFGENQQEPASCQRRSEIRKFGLLSDYFLLSDCISSVVKLQ